MTHAAVRQFARAARLAHVIWVRYVFGMRTFLHILPALAMGVAVLFILLVLVKPSTRERWFMSMRSRDRQAYDRLVMACGNNSALADKMIAHEMLLDERQTRYHATMHALGRIKNYRMSNPRIFR